MQVTLNVPDDLPVNIVQQYISTIEMQMALISKLSLKPTIKNEVVNLKRGSAKNIITFIANDFCEPLDEFKNYM